MTDQPDGTDTGVDRRRVLRAAGAGAAGLLGIVATADRTAASYCPKPPHRWASDDWPDTDRVTDPLVLVDPADERTVAVWKLFLAYTPDDEAAAVARQLLAARLNFQYRPAEDPGCVDQSVSAFGGRTVRELKVAAKEWLRASNWPDEHHGWTVDDVDGEVLRDELAAFNRGGIAELDCHCTKFGAGDSGVVDDENGEDEAKNSRGTDERAGDTVGPSADRSRLERDPLDDAGPSSFSF